MAVAVAVGTGTSTKQGSKKLITSKTDGAPGSAIEKGSGRTNRGVATKKSCRAGWMDVLGEKFKYFRSLSS